MFISRDAPHSLYECGPRLLLLRKDTSAFSRDVVEAAAPLVWLFDPGSLDPSTLFEPIEQGIQGIDVERELAAGPCVDQLTQFVAVAGARVEERENQKLRGASLQLAIQRPGADTCHEQILCRQASAVNSSEVDRYYGPIRPSAILMGRQSGCDKQPGDKQPLFERGNRMRKRLIVGFVLLQLVLGPAGAAQNAPAHAAIPVDPIAAVVDAFRTHEVVTLTDPHGNVQIQAFLLSLVRNPRFPDAANDIVIETASARYQDAIDRFVRGDDVEPDILRKAWEDHTVANSLGIQAEEFIRAVRAVNTSLTESKRLRVVAGDPPIDWDNVVSRQDHARWIELRDSYPADLIRRQVLDRGRRALVVYGQGHLQRRQIATNYDMSAWQAQTVVSLLERDHAARVFNIWTLNRSVELPERAESWRVPSLALLRGTTLGANDFSLYDRGVGEGSRVGVKAGQLVPIPREEWKVMRMEDQFDAFLYLGPPAAMTTTSVPTSLCRDADFVKHRIDRLTRFGPPVEVQNFRKACGL
jgi:hypothetical protein